jgi:type IV secretion system protein TrbC
MMPMSGRVRAGIIVSLAVCGLIAPAVPARAAGSNMPWEQALQQILQSIEGPVTKVIAVIVIITTGLSLAFGGRSRSLYTLNLLLFAFVVGAIAADALWLQRLGGAS